MTAEDIRRLEAERLKPMPPGRTWTDTLDELIGVLHRLLNPAPLPAYRPAIIYSCPDCYGDLQHEGLDDYWCPACHATHHFTRVMYDEGERDD